MATRKNATRRAAAPVQAAAPSANGRTEEDILLQRPIEVVLGGKPYTIAILPIRPQAEWRKKVAPILGGFLRASRISTETPDAFEAGIAAVLTETPEQMLDLFFAYARDLDRKEIEETATEDEVAAALLQIANMVLSPPLLQTLASMMTRAVR